jgi:hypothetical protein
LAPSRLELERRLKRGLGVNAVAVTMPKVAKLSADPGAANVGVFVRLNASPRRYSEYLSMNRNVLKSDTFKLNGPSPETFGSVRDTFRGVYANGSGNAFEFPDITP